MTKQGFKAIFIFLFSVTFSVFASGQTPNNQIRLNRGDSLRLDFSIFRTTLQNNSPSLYRYVDKLKLNVLLDSCYATINSNTTEFNLLNKIKFLMSSIKDGHLYCSPSQKLKQYLNREAMFFPLKLQFIEKKAFMFSPSPYSLPIGTEIISIMYSAAKKCTTSAVKKCTT